MVKVKEENINVTILIDCFLSVLEHVYEHVVGLMLCGELVRSPLSFQSTPRSPYVALLALCEGMAAITASQDDQDIFLGE